MKGKTVDWGVLREFTRLDRRDGATQAIVFGTKGSGKTTLLIDWQVEALAQRQLCIWRGRGLDSWNVFARLGRCLVLQPRDLIYRWAKVPRLGKRLALPTTAQELGVEVVNFTSARQALELLDPDRVNVILTLFDPEQESIWWIALIRLLSERENTRWVHLSLDEIDDIVPAARKGDQWYAQWWFTQHFKDLRKSYVGLRASVHHPRDIDERILTKFKYIVYLRGARVLPDSQVYKAKVRHLRIGEAVIEGSFFQDFSFPAIPGAYDPDHFVRVQNLSTILTGPGAPAEGAREEDQGRGGDLER